MSVIPQIARASASPLLTAAGGLCLGLAIRGVVHHGHAWPVLAAGCAAAWAGAFLSLWLPYRAERRRLLEERAFLLKMRDEVPAMVREALATQEQREGEQR